MLVIEEKGNVLVTCDRLGKLLLFLPCFILLGGRVVSFVSKVSLKVLL